MVRAGTRFERTIEKMDMIKILETLNGYLKNKQEKASLSEFIDVCKKAFTINPKVFQHILEVKYPKRTYSLSDLQQMFTKLEISEVNHDLLVDNSLLVTIIQGWYLKKQTTNDVIKQRFVLYLDDKAKQDASRFNN